MINISFQIFQEKAFSSRLSPLGELSIGIFSSLQMFSMVYCFLIFDIFECFSTKLRWLFELILKKLSDPDSSIELSLDKEMGLKDIASIGRYWKINCLISFKQFSRQL
jgi:hypothetical protein